MTKTLILTAALLGGLALPTLTFAETKIVQGCEVQTVEGTNYSNKVDPTCVFSHQPGGGNTVTGAVGSIDDLEDAIRDLING